MCTSPASNIVSRVPASGTTRNITSSNAGAFPQYPGLRVTRMDVPRTHSLNWYGPVPAAVASRTRFAGPIFAAAAGEIMAVVV